MLENIFSLKVDNRAHTDILDLDFIETDLIEILITATEQTECAMFDAMATLVAEGTSGKFNTPIGKQVF